MIRVIKHVALTSLMFMSTAYCAEASKPDAIDSRTGILNSDITSSASDFANVSNSFATNQVILHINTLHSNDHIQFGEFSSSILLSVNIDSISNYPFAALESALEEISKDSPTLISGVLLRGLEQHWSKQRIANKHISKIYFSMRILRN